MRLPWWQQQAYLEGMTWEFGNGGLYGGGKGGGAGAGESSTVPLDSLEARAAEGISTGVVYQ